jgi:hypothetical protein
MRFSFMSMFHLFVTYVVVVLDYVCRVVYVQYILVVCCH